MPDMLPLVLLVLIGALAAVFPVRVLGLFKKTAKGFTEGMTPHESYGFEWVIRLLGITAFLFGIYGFLKYYKVL